MAEGFYNNYTEKGRAFSAGVEPDKEIHPWTIQLMKEAGINVSGQKPKLLTDELMEKVDKVILLDLDLDLIGCVTGEYVAKLEVWPIKSLLGKSIEQVREVREEINHKVKQLLSTMKAEG
jgi:arsenate reductase (thioredoxin)